ncbi:hypothetical protein D3C85_1536490 [compost metagenome]
MCIEKGGDGVHESSQQLAPTHRQLTSHKVHGLDAIGAFVEGNNANIAYQLLHSVLTDVAMAAKDLHAERAGLGA